MDGDGSTNMLIESNWDIFKYSFSENPQKYFEWMCYLLFCKEFNCEKGITTYENQTALETSPIKVGNDIIGFQAKFYEVKLSARKKELIETIDKSHNRYPELTKILFYINKNWTEGKPDEKTQDQIEVEEYASKRGIKIVWRTDFYFRSPEVAEKYANIIQKFFSKTTSSYYENIKKKEPEKTIVNEKDKYTTLLNIEKVESVIDKFSLFNFIDRSLKEKGLPDFKNIYVKGVGGISKSTEMKFAYNKLISKLSSADSCCVYNFLPTPYFFELKYFHEGCFENITSEIPLLFLDGLDEISDSIILILIKELNNLKSKSSNCRFVLAGRDASFIKETNDKLPEHINTTLDSYCDEEVQQLKEKFARTPLESVVQIPFYRDFVAKETENIPTTYKEFFSKLISEKLFDDKQRLNIGKNISSMRSALEINQEKINLENLEDKISNMVHELFKSKRSLFTKEDVLKYLGEEAFFFITSFLVDYRNDESISFCSNVYFDYFLAKFYSKQDFNLIHKDLLFEDFKFSFDNFSDFFVYFVVEIFFIIFNTFEIVNNNDIILKNSLNVTETTYLKKLFFQTTQISLRIITLLFSLLFLPFIVFSVGYDVLTEKDFKTDCQETILILLDLIKNEQKLYKKISKAIVDSFFISLNRWAASRPFNEFNFSLPLKVNAACAKICIMQTATKWNFWHIKYRLMKAIILLKNYNYGCYGIHVKYMIDFLNEIEQKVSFKHACDK